VVEKRGEKRRDGEERGWEERGEEMLCILC